MTSRLKYFLIYLFKSILSGIVLFFVVICIGLGSVRLWLGPELENWLNNSEKVNSFLSSHLTDNYKLKINNAQMDWSKQLIPSLKIQNVELFKNSKPDSNLILIIDDLEANFGLRSFLSIFHRKIIFDSIEVEKLNFFIEDKSSSSFTLILENLVNDNFIDSYFSFPISSYQGSLEIFDTNIIRVDNNEENNFDRLNFGKISLNSGLDFTNLNVEKIEIKELKKVFNYNNFFSIQSSIPEGVISSLVIKVPNKLGIGYERPSYFDQIEINGDFKDISLYPKNDGVGFSKIDGFFSLKSKLLEINVQGSEVRFWAPKIFSTNEIYFSDLKGKISSDKFSLYELLFQDIRSKDLMINFLHLENPEIKVKTSGKWFFKKEEEKQKIDLFGEIYITAPQAANNYLPLAISPKVRSWLSRGLRSGGEVRGVFDIRGSLNDFPFRNKNDSNFFNLKFFPNDLDLLFSKRWPILNGLNGVLELEGSSLFFSQVSGFFEGIQLTNVSGKIEDMFAKEPILIVNGLMEGNTQNLIKISNNSPVKKWLWNFTEKISANGNSKLDLNLILDLKKIKESTAHGNLQIKQNSFKLSKNFPEVDNLNGKIIFSHNNLLKLNLEGNFLGGKIDINKFIKPYEFRPIKIKVNGDLKIKKLREHFSKSKKYVEKDFIIGRTSYDFDVLLSEGDISLIGHSNLFGVEIVAPEPFFKLPNERLDLRVEFLKPKNHEESKKGRNYFKLSIPEKDLYFGMSKFSSVNSEKVINDNFSKTGFFLNYGENNSDKNFDLKNIFLGASNILQINKSYFDLGAWLKFLLEQKNSFEDVYEFNNENSITQIDLNVDNLLWGSNSFSNFKGIFFGGEKGWSGDFDSTETRGFVNWLEDKKNLEIKLSKLYLNGKFSENDNYLLSNIDNDYPFSVHIVIDEFKNHFGNLGQIELETEYLSKSKYWKINRLSIFFDETRIDSSGFWENKHQKKISNANGVAKKNLDSYGTTEMNFRLDTVDSGKILDKLGYSGLVNGAGGIISGQVSWVGSPLFFSLKNAVGELSLDIDDGKFLKADPGLARLVGIVNLQSLPKRIKLDFKDIFSEGFAFDRLRGNISLNKGLASTDNFRAIGTQATIFMDGSVDLINKSQNMRVLVLPELNAGLASLGYVLVNPAVGLGSFIAQYILRDPLRKILAYEYKISGSWIDPTVKKKAVEGFESVKNN